MTAREFAEKCPENFALVDLSEWIAVHGWDAELPPFDPSEVQEGTMTIYVYRSNPNKVNNG